MTFQPPTRQKQTTIFHPTALAAGLATLLLATASVMGQAPISGPVDENYDLNIAERHINETSFHRGTELSADSGALRLRVGAAVDAETIDVRLRGVSGHVSFRADLGPLSDRLKRLAALVQERR